MSYAGTKMNDSPRDRSSGGISQTYQTAPHIEEHQQTAEPPAGARDAFSGSLGKPVAAQSFTEKRVRKMKNARDDLGSLGPGGGHRGQKRQAPPPANVSIFDHTTLEQMPNVKVPTLTGNPARRKKEAASSANKYKGPPIDLGGGMGYVNYVNGVPVSIQLNEADLVAGDGVLGRLLQKPTSNWQQNLLKRARIMGGNDLHRVHLRKEADGRARAL